MHGAVRLRRVGGGEHERLRLVVLPRPQLPQPLDSSAERELRAAEPFDEVAAPARAERLERPQLAVDRAVAAGNPLGPDGVARDDAVPLEQQLRERAPVGLAAGEQLGRERPASLRRGRAMRAGAGEAARPAVRPRRLVAPLGAQRRPGVVRHLAAPDEIPEGRERGLGVEPGGAEEPVPEERAAGERRADRVVRLAFRDRRGCGTSEQRRVVAEEDGDAVEPGSDPHELA